MENKKKIVVLTGAGVSAESGIKTFRDANGLWEGHDVMEVASPEGWHNNKEKVLEFYNQRRRQLKEVHPNEAHTALADLQKDFEVIIVTQNVDDLHERAGSTNVIHLHGELFKVQSEADENYIMEWKKDLNLGDFDNKGNQLRPHVVWFGEAVPMLHEAIKIVEQADVLMIVGTSMQVYPAAGLLDFAPSNIPVFFVDPKPAVVPTKNLFIYAEKASVGVPRVVNKLRAEFL